MANNFYSLTDVGLKRKLNEDAVFSEKVNIPNCPIYTVLLIADGMGGHNAGEIASREAAQVIKQFFVFGDYIAFAKKTGSNPKNIKKILYDTIFYINKKIRNMSQSSSSEKGMGTTLTVALVMRADAEGNRDIIVGHVGDSRAYIFSNKEIRLLTKDDSLVWQYYARGIIKFEEMRTHKERNVITQALGGDTLEKPQVFVERLKKHEVLLLCTDGLHGLVNDNQMKYVLSTAPNLEISSKQLIGLANKAGGKDNISVALFSDKNKHFKSKSKLKLFSIIGSAAVILIVAAILGMNYLFSKPEHPTNTKNTAQVTAENKKPSSNKIAKSDSLKINANIFNWKINPADKKVKIKRGQGKAKVIIQLKNGVSNNKKYYLRISGDDGEHATNDTYFIQKIQVPLSFTQKGTRPVTFTIVNNNSNTCDTTFTFDVIKPKIYLGVKAKIIAGANVKIVGYKYYRKKISKIYWGDGKTKKEQRHTYKNILSIPDHITIIDIDENKHSFRINR